MDTDVVVVGAGPTGLLLACELRRWGVRTLVFERRHERDERLRAQGLTRLGAQALDRHGLLERLADFAELAELVPDPSSPLPPFLPGVRQQIVEYLLEGRALELGTGLLLGHDVVEVSQDAHGVTVATLGPGGARGTVRGRYVVGCDGSHSSVRRCAGFVTRDTPPTATGYQALATVLLPSQAPALPPGSHRTTGGIVAWQPGPCRVVSIEFSPPPDRWRQVTLDEVQASLRRTSGMDLTLTAPRSLARFTNASKLAHRYAMGRILLAGDAAHVHPPNGGQGINLGLNDAVNLGWKLAAAVQGWGSPALLDTYQSERQPVAERVIRNALADMSLMDPNERLTPAYELYTEIKNSEHIRPHLFEMISTTHWVYDMGVPADRAHSLLGQTVGDLPVESAAGRQRIGRLLRDGRAALVDYAHRGELRAVALAWAGKINIVTAVDTGLEDVRAVLVRPDGCVAWVKPWDGAAQPGDLRDALVRWLGEPADAPVARKTGPPVIGVQP